MADWPSFYMLESLSCVSKQHSISGRVNAMKMSCMSKFFLFLSLASKWIFE